VIEAYGQATTSGGAGGWIATALGGLLAVSVLTWVVLASLRALRRRRHRQATAPLPVDDRDPHGRWMLLWLELAWQRGRGWTHYQTLLSAEAAMTRDLFAGRMDAATYRTWMGDLARRTEPVPRSGRR